jgi:post-segregation antitoxin (ccd killing protein)
MATVIRGGVTYAITTVTIPVELREWAKNENISMSELLTRALKEAKNERKTD